MSLFVCDECGVVENTALCTWDGYWGRNLRPERKGDALCSQCEPRSKGWHGKFPREQWDGKSKLINR